MVLDDAFAAAKALVGEVGPRLQKIETEQDARLQLVNRFLLEVLGWNYPDFETEHHSENGYSDYLLTGSGRRRLVVEAKRIGRLVDSVAPGARTYKISGPALKSAFDGIQQAALYCLDVGVNLAILTDGVCWIVFRPFPAPGLSYTESNAFVFKDHDAVLEQFALFHDLVSKAAVIANTHTLRFAKDGGLTVAEFEPLLSANRSEDAKLMSQSDLARDLEPVFREFFGTMSAENDREMLIECFVETKESRFADASLEKLLTSVTTAIAELGSSEKQLEKEITSSIESGRGANVIIIGNAGAGKSTFLERFFDSVLEPATRAKCLVLRVDFGGTTVDLASLNSFINRSLKARLEESLYGAAGPTFEQLQGLYFAEYLRRSRGEFRPLYERDKNEFKEDFGKYLDKQINVDPFGYITRMLSNVVKDRKKLPCIIFDNTDSLPDQRLQEAIFQFGNGLRETVPHSVVVTPITDRSFWRLSKQGPFQAYPSKKFYLPVPPTKTVLERRVDYLKRKISDADRSGQYFTTRGIRLSVENITAFAACLEETFLREDFVSRRISWLANNNIRRCLELAQVIIMSPFFSVDDLLKTYIASGANAYQQPHYTKFMQALILGNYNIYQPDQNEFVTNVFEISPHSPTSPLTSLSLLRVLIDRAGEGSGAAAYMSVEQLRQLFETLGVSETAVNQAISNLLINGLIDTYDTSKETIETSERIAITHCGRMHYEMATTDPIYVAEMAFATPIRDMDLVEMFRSMRDRGIGGKEWQDLERTFAQYLIGQDEEFCRLPSDEIFDGQRQLRRAFKARWIERRSITDERTASHKEEPITRPMGYSHIPMVMKWYNVNKGYGFAEAGLSEEVFVHYALLTQAGIQDLFTGDTLIGDVAVTNQGKLQAIAIHSFERGVGIQDGHQGRVIEGYVKFYNRNRAFGFIRSSIFDEDIYFSAKALERGGLRDIQDGSVVWARVEPGRFGKGIAATVVATTPIEGTSAN